MLSLPPGRASGRKIASFPGCVGIDIHGSSYIGMTQKLLHILGCCTVGQQVGSEGMSEQMEMKLSKVRHYFPRPAADAAYRCGGFKGSILSCADHRQFLVPLRHFLGSGQAVHLVVDPVLFPYFLVVVKGIKGAVLQAVFALLCLGLSQKCRQGVAEVHGTDFLSLVLPSYLM